MLIDLSKKVLVILQGVPCAGKSTFVREHHLENYTISFDEIRVKIGAVTGSDLTMEKEPLVRSIFSSMLCSRMENGVATVIDNTNLTPQSLSRILTVANALHYDVTYIRFDCDVDEILKRNKERKAKQLTNIELARYIDYYRKLKNECVKPYEVEFINNELENIQ